MKQGLELISWLSISCNAIFSPRAQVCAREACSLNLVPYNDFKGGKWQQQ
jgi:hypothetical protein